MSVKKDNVTDLIDFRRTNFREGDEAGYDRIRKRVYVMEEPFDHHVLKSRVGLTYEEFLETLGIGMCVAVILVTVYMIFNSIFIF